RPACGRILTTGGERPWSRLGAVHRAPRALPVRLSQLTLEHLAGRRRRQCFDELPAPRDLQVGNQGRTMLLELVGVCCGTVAPYDDGMDPLAALVIGHADHGTRCHVRV